MPLIDKSQLSDLPECWPSLPLESWDDTRATLHMWTQMVGKVRLALTPLVNHWWNVPLYVSARGLTTSSMSYESMVFELEFDFVDHRLAARTSRGDAASFPLRPRTVAELRQGARQADASGCVVLPHPFMLTENSHSGPGL